MISFVLLLVCINVRDQTRTGHVLGEAGRRSEAPERQMTSAQSCVLRLLMHLAMLQGTTRNQRVRLHLDLHQNLHISGMEKVASRNGFCVVGSL